MGGRANREADVLPEEWPRARSVLTEALKVPTGERTRFIEDAFPNNPRLWDELLAILDGYDKATHSHELEWSEDPELNKLLPTVPRAPGSGSSASEKSTAMLAVGHQYGSYRVLRELTPGGMGQVFLAEDVRMPRRVVLKSLSGKWLESEAAHQRFRGEANSACVLNHGNIATLYDVVEDKGQFLLVFEYVEGRTLRRAMGEGSVPLGLALRLAIQLTDAITYAHDQGIFHCDIKPENIQVTPDNRLKVLDFGLARARYDTGKGMSEADRGKLLGTAGYMAPERLARGTLNAAGDIYCIGVVLFELLTGRHPYPERGPTQVLAVLGTDAPRPSTLVGGVSPDLDMISERALSRDPTLRYQSAREFGRDLRRVLDRLDAPQTPVPSRVEEPQKTRRDPTFWLLAGVAAIPAVLIVLTLIGFASVIMFNSPLGRVGDFEPESPLWWPWRGVESLLAPLLLTIGFAVFLSLAPLALRVFSLGPLRTWFAPLRSAVNRGVEIIKSQPIALLAAAVLLVQLLLAAVVMSRFDAVFEGVSGFITKRPPVDLSPLRPGNRPELNSFTKSFSYQVVIFGFVWYAVIRHRHRRKETGGTLTIVAGVAVTLLTLLYGQVFPRQIIYKNRFERVAYQSKRCYLVGQHASDGLLFCPHEQPPWSTIVKLDDPQLRREGAVESIFSGFEQGQ
jgi:serine/threonine protein kinase